MFTVRPRNNFTAWFRADLNEDQRIDALALIEVLKEKGPNLGRPYADTVYDSKHTNMKELRIQSGGRPLRVFFAFDPLRQGILLCGGFKDGAGDKKFYKEMIKLADEEFDDHLKEIQDDGEES